VIVQKFFMSRKLSGIFFFESKLLLLKKLKQIIFSPFFLLFAWSENQTEINQRFKNHIKLFFSNRRMPKSVKDPAPIPGCLRMPVKMTLRRVLVPDASNSTVLRLFTDERTTWYIQIDDLAVHLTPDIKIWHGCISRSQDCDVWKIERRVEKTDQFKTMIIFESCPKTKRYKIDELIKFVHQSGAIFSNTETRDLGLLTNKEERKNKPVPKIEPDRNLLAPPETEQLYYYILPPKDD